MVYDALRAYENKLCSGVEEGVTKFHNIFGKQILEIGFGKGKLLKLLSKQGNKCFGIEASKLAIITAEKEDINANIIMLDVSNSKLPYQDGHFDLLHEVP